MAATMTSEQVPPHQVVPPGVELRQSVVDDNALGAWSTKPLQQGEMFGPYTGIITKEGDKTEVDFRFAWEVYDNSTNKLMYIINATKPQDGCWMRYVNCARFFEEQNFVSIQEGRDIFYKAIKDIDVGVELLTWFDAEALQSKFVKKGIDNAAVSPGKKPRGRTKSLASPEGPKTGFDSPKLTPKKSPSKKIKSGLTTDHETNSPVKNRKTKSSPASSRMGPPVSSSHENNDSQTDISGSGVSTRLRRPTKRALSDDYIDSTTLQFNSKNGDVKVIALRSRKDHSLMSPHPSSKTSVAKDKPYKVIVKPASKIKLGYQGKTEVKKGTSVTSVENLSAKRNNSRNLDSLQKKQLIKPSKVHSSVVKRQTLIRGKILGQYKKRKSPSAANSVKLGSECFYRFEIQDCHKHRVESGEMLYKCTFCPGLTYQQSNSLKRHYLRTHIFCKYISLFDLQQFSINSKTQMANVVGNPDNNFVNDLDFDELMRVDRIKKLRESSHEAQRKNSTTKLEADVCKKSSIDETIDFVVCEIKREEAMGVRHIGVENVLRSISNNDRANIKSIQKALWPSVQTRDVTPVYFPGLYRCHKCERLLDYVEDLLSHLDEHVTDSMEATPSGLPSRLRSKPFSCEKCSMHFTFKRNMMRHMLCMHHDITPYSCSTCSQAFATKNLLSRHKLSHNGKNIRIKCPHCALLFVRKIEANKHVWKLHENEIQKCVLCNQTFFSLAAYELHSNSNHVMISDGFSTERVACDDGNDVSNTDSNPDSMHGRPATKRKYSHRVARDKSKVVSVTSENVVSNSKDASAESEAVDNEIPKFKTSRFGYSCAVCRKRFRIYAHMYRHHRMAHPDPQTVPIYKKSLIASSNIRRHKDEVVDKAPLEWDMEYFATIPANVKYNLDNHLDGKRRAIRRVRDIIIIEGYTSIWDYNPTPPHEERLCKYNFQKDFCFDFKQYTHPVLSPGVTTEMIAEYEAQQQAIIQAAEAMAMRKPLKPRKSKLVKADKVVFNGTPPSDACLVSDNTTEPVLDGANVTQNETSPSQPVSSNDVHITSGVESINEHIAQSPTDSEKLNVKNDLQKAAFVIHATRANADNCDSLTDLKSQSCHSNDCTNLPDKDASSYHLHKNMSNVPPLCMQEKFEETQEYKGRPCDILADVSDNTFIHHTKVYSTAADNDDKMIHETGITLNIPADLCDGKHESCKVNVESSIHECSTEEVCLESDHKLQVVTVFNEHDSVTGSHLKRLHSESSEPPALSPVYDIETHSPQTGLSQNMEEAPQLINELDEEVFLDVEVDQPSKVYEGAERHSRKYSHLGESSVCSTTCKQPTDNKPIVNSDTAVDILCKSSDQLTSSLGSQTNLDLDVGQQHVSGSLETLTDATEKSSADISVRKTGQEDYAELVLEQTTNEMDKLTPIDQSNRSVQNVTESISDNLSDSLTQECVSETVSLSDSLTGEDNISEAVSQSQSASQGKCKTGTVEQCETDKRTYHQKSEASSENIKLSASSQNKQHVDQLTQNSDPPSDVIALPDSCSSESMNGQLSTRVSGDGKLGEMGKFCVSEHSVEPKASGKKPNSENSSNSVTRQRDVKRSSLERLIDRVRLRVHKDQHGKTDEDQHGKTDDQHGKTDDQHGKTDDQHGKTDEIISPTTECHTWSDIQAVNECSCDNDSKMSEPTLQADTITVNQATKGDIKNRLMGNDSELETGVRENMDSTFIRNIPSNSSGDNIDNLVLGVINDIVSTISDKVGDVVNKTVSCDDNRVVLTMLEDTVDGVSDHSAEEDAGDKKVTVTDEGGPIRHVRKECQTNQVASPELTTTEVAVSDLADNKLTVLDTCITPNETTVPNLTPNEIAVPALKAIETTVSDLTTIETMVPNLTSNEREVPNLTSNETTLSDLTSNEATLPNLTSNERAVPELRSNGTKVSDLRARGTVLPDIVPIKVELPDESIWPSLRNQEKRVKEKCFGVTNTKQRSLLAYYESEDSKLITGYRPQFYLPLEFVYMFEKARKESLLSSHNSASNSLNELNGKSLNMDTVSVCQDETRYHEIDKDNLKDDQSYCECKMNSENDLHCTCKHAFNGFDDKMKSEFFTNINLIKKSMVYERSANDSRVFKCQRSDYTTSLPYEQTVLGANGKIMYVCMVCKAQYAEIYDLAYHQYKKHTSVECHHLEIEDSYGIREVHFPRVNVSGYYAGIEMYLFNPKAIVKGTFYYTCSRCFRRFSEVKRLHTHIIECAPKPKIKPMSEKRKNALLLSQQQSAQSTKNGDTIRRMYKGCRKRRVVTMAEPVIVAKSSMETKLQNKCKNGHHINNGHITNKSKADVSFDNDLAGNKRKKSMELMYNPNNHRRRRETVELLEEHKCRGCGFKFSTISLLERHIKRDCTEQQKLRDTETIQKNLASTALTKARDVCRYCFRTFTYAKSLVNHYRHNYCNVRRNLAATNKLKLGDLQMEDKLEMETRRQGYILSPIKSPGKGKLNAITDSSLSNSPERQNISSRLIVKKENDNKPYIDSITGKSKEISENLVHLSPKISPRKTPVKKVKISPSCSPMASPQKRTSHTMAIGQNLSPLRKNKVQTSGFHLDKKQVDAELKQSPVAPSAAVVSTTIKSPKKSVHGRGKSVLVTGFSIKESPSKQHTEEPSPFKMPSEIPPFRKMKHSGLVGKRTRTKSLSPTETETMKSLARKRSASVSPRKLANVKSIEDKRTAKCGQSSHSPTPMMTIRPGRPATKKPACKIAAGFVRRLTRSHSPKTQILLRSSVKSELPVTKHAQRVLNFSQDMSKCDENTKYSALDGNSEDKYVELHAAQNSLRSRSLSPQCDINVEQGQDTTMSTSSLTNGMNTPRKQRQSKCNKRKSDSIPNAPGEDVSPVASSKRKVVILKTISNSLEGTSLKEVGSITEHGDILSEKVSKEIVSSLTSPVAKRKYVRKQVPQTEEMTSSIEDPLKDNFSNQPHKNRFVTLKKIKKSNEKVFPKHLATSSKVEKAPQSFVKQKIKTITTLGRQKRKYIRKQKVGISQDKGNPTTVSDSRENDDLNKQKGMILKHVSRGANVHSSSVIEASNCAAPEAMRRIEELNKELSLRGRKKTRMDSAKLLHGIASKTKINTSMDDQTIGPVRGLKESSKPLINPKHGDIKMVKRTAKMDMSNGMVRTKRKYVRKKLSNTAAIIHNDAVMEVAEASSFAEQTDFLINKHKKKWYGTGTVTQSDNTVVDNVIIASVNEVEGSPKTVKNTEFEKIHLVKVNPEKKIMGVKRKYVRKKLPNATEIVHPSDVSSKTVTNIQGRNIKVVKPNSKKNMDHKIMRVKRKYVRKKLPNSIEIVHPSHNSAVDDGIIASMNKADLSSKTVKNTDSMKSKLMGKTAKKDMGNEIVRVKRKYVRKSLPKTAEIEQSGSLRDAAEASCYPDKTNLIANEKRKQCDDMVSIAHSDTIMKKNIPTLAVCKTEETPQQPVIKKTGKGSTKSNLPFLETPKTVATANDSSSNHAQERKDSPAKSPAKPSLDGNSNESIKVQKQRSLLTKHSTILSSVSDQINEDAQTKANTQSSKSPTTRNLLKTNSSVFKDSMQSDLGKTTPRKSSPIKTKLAAHGVVKSERVYSDDRTGDISTRNAHLVSSTGAQVVIVSPRGRSPLRSAPSTQVESDKYDELTVSDVTHVKENDDAPKVNISSIVSNYTRVRSPSRSPVSSVKTMVKSPVKNISVSDQESLLLNSSNTGQNIQISKAQSLLTGTTVIIKTSCTKRKYDHDVNSSSSEYVSEKKQLRKSSPRMSSVSFSENVLTGKPPFNGESSSVDRVTGLDTNTVPSLNDVEATESSDCINSNNSHSVSSELLDPDIVSRAVPKTSPKTSVRCSPLIRSAVNNADHLSTVVSLEAPTTENMTSDLLDHSYTTATYDGSDMTCNTGN